MKFEDKEQYNNIIEMLINILKFYSNKENYIKKESSIQSPIEMDGGSQAKFVLEQVNNILNSLGKLNDDYKNILNEVEINSNNVEDVGDFLRKISEFNNKNYNNNEKLF
jgi:hypothetical protein